MSDVLSQAEGNFRSPELTEPLAPPDQRRRARLWPGVLLVVAQAGLMFVPPLFMAGTMPQIMMRFYGPMVCGVAVLLWWLFASRLRWSERLIGLAAFVGVTVGTVLLCHPSFYFGLFLYVLPLVTSAWVVWMVVSIPLAVPARLWGLLAVFLVIGAGSTLVRMAGVTGDFSAELRWRWAPTPEDEFLARYHSQHGEATGVAPVPTSQAAEWSGFRGPDRDGRLKGVRIDTDWSAHPPKQVWRHPVGPGWGSFAVAGRAIYTQEQRGKVEAVVCYDGDTGEEVWAHEDADERFEETISGAGPRATPTYHEGAVYAFTARGRLHCLDAATGRVVWSRDAKEDAGAKVPMWGFAASPLVWKGVVTVFTGGPDGKSVTAYDAAQGGDPLWQKGKGDHGYCSPQPARLGGVEQILIASNAGLTAHDPVKGEVLWHYGWPLDTPRCVQPVPLDDTDVLLGTGMGMGERRVRVEKKGDAWAEPAEVWTSKKLNAYFNDRVTHKGHVYGFDGNMFTCLALDDGKARWRGGRYGNGQVLLLPDQDLLLVLSEKGEAVLVAADSEKHRELGRFQAIEGKTWNHPVVARGKLFVRNGEEAACYELAGWKATE